MKNLLVLVMIGLLFFMLSCRKFDDVKFDMTKEDVIAAWGKTPLVNRPSYRDVREELENSGLFTSYSKEQMNKMVIELVENGELWEYHFGEYDCFVYFYKGKVKKSWYVKGEPSNFQRNILPALIIGAGLAASGDKHYNYYGR